MINLTNMVMEASDVAVTSGGVLAILAGSFAWIRSQSSKLTKVKGKFGMSIDLLRRAVELAESLETAISDNKISKQEIETIKADLAEVKAAYKALTGK